MNDVNCRSYFDSMSADENRRLQLKYAECIYSNALSFHAATTNVWKEFFNMIRPNFQLPTREQLANELLNETFKRVSKQAIRHVEKSSYITLIIDGWTNVNKDAIINIVAMTPQPVFIRSIDTKGVCKDADYMFNLLAAVIDDIGPSKVVGLISDNEAKMLSLKDKIIKEYKHITFNGCVSHQLHNLIKKICQLGPVKRIVDATKEIIDEINNHHNFHANYRTLMREDKSKSITELKTYSETRFAGTVLMMKSLMAGISSLRTIYSNPENKVKERTKQNILGYADGKDFYKDVVSLEALLNPICVIIHQIESDNCSIADMLELTFKLDVIELDSCEIFDEEIKKSISSLISNCLQKLRTPAALLANILHPHYRGKKFNSSQKCAASSLLTVISKQLGFDKNTLIESFQHYIGNDFFFSNPFVTQMETRKPITWWRYAKNMSDHKLLSDVALRLLHIHPTNTAVERTFSRQKFIHRRERNRLSSEKVNMLMNIHSNLNLFRNIEKDCEQIFPSNISSTIIEIIPEDVSDAETDEDDDAVVIVPESEPDDE